MSKEMHGVQSWIARQGYSPGKLAFFKKLIATEIILSQCIFIRSPDQHTKSPKESSHGKYANLHKSNMAANKLEMAISL